MGLRSGDAIRSINGLPITSPESFIQAEQSCAEKSKIIIVIEREGSVINIPLSMR
jgi:type II secretory pathway component PulC